MDRRVRSAPLVAVGLVAVSGCADLIGIDDWAPSPSATSATTTSGSTGGSGGSGAASTTGAGGFENATCADGFRNGLETDVDCGGDACLPCAQGLACNNDADCVSGNCDGLVCGPKPAVPPCSPVDPDNPSCGDCTLNGFETGVDCGGDACPPCDTGEGCTFDNDCATGNCIAGSCGPSKAKGCVPVDPDNPSCGDCTKNGSETGVDCGGDACGPCAQGLGCNVDGDCATSSCVAGSCGPAQAPVCLPLDPDNPNCADCTKNGLETAVDCGGDACGPCPPGKGCSNDADCASGACTAGTCQ